MSTNQPKRATRELTPEEVERLKKNQALVAAELPDLIARDQMRKEAQDEQTLSGELRRAIHTSGMSLSKLAEKAGVTTLMLDEFLTGERTLRSDVLDRLVACLGFKMQRVANP